MKVTLDKYYDVTNYFDIFSLVMMSLLLHLILCFNQVMGISMRKMGPVLLNAKIIKYKNVFKHELIILNNEKLVII